MPIAEQINKLKRLSSFLGEYFDLLLAVLGGVTVAILGLTDQIGTDHLEEATLVVLAALSAGLVRERWRRDQLGDAVRQVVDMTDTKAPWEALEAEYQWEILNNRGTDADASSRKVLRFLQTQTLTIYEFSGAPGSVSAHRCKGGWPKTAPKKELQVLDHNFPGLSGKKYTIVSLEGVKSRGQMLEVLSERKLTNTFCQEHEYVKVSVEVPTEALEMSVTWPSTRAPKNVLIEQGSQPALAIAESSIERLKDGRARYKHSVPCPELGETITLSWDW